MAKNEIQQDAHIAAHIQSPGQKPTPPSGRTPHWVWAWSLPLVALIFLYLARGILGPFIIAGVLAYIFSLVVDRIQAHLGWPRALIVTLMYLIALGVLGVGLYFSAEIIYEQTRQFITGGPDIVERGLRQVMGGSSYSFGGQTFDARTLAMRINDAMAGFFGAGTSSASGTGGGGDALRLLKDIAVRMLDIFLVIIVSFYLLLSGNSLGAYLLKFVPADGRARTGYMAGRIHTVLGAYLRGQLILIALMSFVSFLVLQFVFNVPYAVPIAILTGFLEILPLLGPAIAAVLASGVALSAHGAGAAIGVIVAYVILRQLEDQLVMPMIVGRAVELHPVATIFAVLAGGAMAGVLGMLLAVPAAAAIKIILDFLYPTNPENAMAQAQPGLNVAAKEAETRGEDSGETAPAATL